MSVWTQLAWIILAAIAIAAVASIAVDAYLDWHHHRHVIAVMRREYERPIPYTLPDPHDVMTESQFLFETTARDVDGELRDLLDGNWEQS